MDCERTAYYAGAGLLISCLAQFLIYHHVIKCHSQLCLNKMTNCIGTRPMDYLKIIKTLNSKSSCIKT